MSWTQLADLAAAVCILLGALLALIAAIGVVRLPDLLTRMHAATKPQVLGTVLVMTGVALRLRELEVVGVLALAENAVAANLGLAALGAAVLTTATVALRR